MTTERVDKSPRVTAIDDDLEYLRLTQQMLTMYEICEPKRIQAISSSDELDSFLSGEGEKPELVLLDSRMWGDWEAGLTTLRQIKANPLFGKTQVLVVTADDSQSRRDAFESLGVEVITKPFDPKILIKKIKRILKSD